MALRRRHAFDQRQHGLHFRAVRDDVVVLVFHSECFAQCPVFLAELLGAELLANDEHELGERKRLENVVAGASLHGFDGGLDRAVGGHDDDGHVRVRAPDGLKEFEAAHAGQFEIGDDQIVRLLAEHLQTGLGVGRGLGNEAFVAKLELEQDAASWLRLRR